MKGWKQNMVKIRILILLATILFVGSIGTLVAIYAKGFRFDSKTLRLLPSGILAAKSDPDGASVFVNGELKTATNNTISLPPGNYDVEIKKEGYQPWQKRLSIEKEVVTQISVDLFTIAPSLSAITFNGVSSPTASPDLSRIVYFIREKESQTGSLWIMETLNFPIGFAKEPRQIADGILETVSWRFSPNGRQLLVTDGPNAYLLDTSTFTSQDKRINVAKKKNEILANWQEKVDKKASEHINSLPNPVYNFINEAASEITFSPDDTKILYRAKRDFIIPENLVPQLPGSSTQKQERDIRHDQTYVYDIKEDRNFFVTGRDIRLSWLPTSRHLLLPEEDKIVIMDYDGTNKKVVYEGAYVSPHAYAYVNASKLLILTNLGASSQPPNFYSLSIK